MVNIATPGIHIPTCDKDNSFTAKQCHGDKCWCVLKNGEVIKDSEKDKKLPLNCLALRKKYPPPTKCQKKASAKSGFRPKCNPNGHYSVVQCLNARYCWCSTPSGEMIPKTLHKKNAPKKPDCHRHLGLYYNCAGNPERFLILGTKVDSSSATIQTFSLVTAPLGPYILQGRTTFACCRELNPLP